MRLAPCLQVPGHRLLAHFAQIVSLQPPGTQEGGEAAGGVAGGHSEGAGAGAGGGSPGLAGQVQRAERVVGLGGDLD